MALAIPQTPHACASPSPSLRFPAVGPAAQQADGDRDDGEGDGAGSEIEQGSSSVSSHNLVAQHSEHPCSTVPTAVDNVRWSPPQRLTRLRSISAFLGSSRYALDNLIDPGQPFDNESSSHFGARHSNDEHRRRSAVFNFVHVPLLLEHFLLITTAICAADFLSIFATLPLRVSIKSIPMLRSMLLHRPPPAVKIPRDLSINADSHSPGRASPSDPCLVLPPAHEYSPAQFAVDIGHLSLFIVATCILFLFDVSRIYHGIRGQSFIKLYVVVNVVELFDKLLSSFGVDLLDSLGASLCRLVDSASSTSSTFKSPVRWQKRQLVMEYLLSLAYVSVHAVILLCWVVTLNVAVNSQNNMLLTLLISNNFVELKSSALKSLKLANLFQLSCGDGVERFQLFMFLIIMLVYTHGDRRLHFVWFMIYLCEVVIDWTKHSFAVKFNRVSCEAYPAFLKILCADFVQFEKQYARSIGGSGVSKRLGFVTIPLAALVARMTLKAVFNCSPGVVCLIIAGLLCIKLVLSAILRDISIRASATGLKGSTPNSNTGLETDGIFSNLINVDRYGRFSV